MHTKGCRLLFLKIAAFFTFHVTTFLTLNSAPTHLYDIVHAGNDFYLIVNGVAKLISDADTVSNFDFDPNKVENISLALLKNLRLGEAVPVIHLNPKAYDINDEVMRVEMLKSSALNGHLMYGFEYLGEYVNPAVTIWHDRMVMATGLSVGFAGSIRRPANEHVEFRWFNHSLFPISHDDGKYLGIGMEIDPLPAPGSGGSFIGQDPRLVVDTEHNDTLLVLSTNRFGPRLRMALTFVDVDPVSGLARNRKYYSTLVPTHGSPDEHHKNWSPFMHHGELMLIQSINPLIVVSTSNHQKTSPSGQLFADVVSKAQELKLSRWRYGSLRGGTNAVRIRDRARGEFYLGFFHTTQILPHNYLHTYMTGAFTFSAEPPFELLEMSPMPIIEKKFYTGPWDPLKNRGIDFCLFPMSLSLVEDKGLLLLGIGHNDHSGWVMKVDLNQLLNTLVRIN